MMSISNFREGSEGNSAVVWSNKLQKWFCGDSEGNLFAKAFDEEDHDSTSLTSDTIRSVAFHPTKDECAIAENDIVSVRSATNLESVIDQDICKSTLPFTHIEYDHQGHFIFAASMESDVSVISVEKGATQKISTGNVGVRTFSLSPDSRHIAIVDIDGSVCVNALNFNSSSLSQHDMVSYTTGLISKSATRNATESGCKVSWYPSTTKVLLAVPSLKGSVVVLTPGKTASDERKWDESFVIAPSGDEGPSHGQTDLSMAEFSPNGAYLATADLSGTVLVWAFDVKDASDSQPLYKLNSTPLVALRDIVWGRRATDNYIIAATANDWHQFPEVVRGGKALPALLEGSVVPSKHHSVAAEVSFTQAPTQTGTQMDDLDESDMIAAVEAAEAQYAKTQEAQAVQEKIVSPSSSTTSATAAKSVTKSVVAASTSALKRLTKVSNASASDEEDDLLFGDDDDSVVAVSAPLTTSEAVPATTEEETVSLAAIKAKHTPSSTAQKASVSTSSKHLIDDEAEDDDDDDYDNDDADMIVDDNNTAMSLQQMMQLAKSGALPALAAPERVQQSPFQPSSTKFDEKRRRYLVWNNVGSIVLREESIENRVEITFANTAGANRNETFPDRDGFTMGALAYEGAVFASPPETPEEPAVTADAEFRKETPGSTIVYHAFAGQRHLLGANESFRWTLSDSEAALAVAVGKGWVAVATSKNLLYVFNSAGMPVTTVALSGPVVALSGSDMQLGVVYHAHGLSCDLYEINWQAGCRVKKITTNSLPLPAKVDNAAHTATGVTALLNTTRREQALEWMGFDMDHRLLTILDAQGVVWSLVQCAGYQWVPVLDTHRIRKSTEHSFWPVQVKFGKLVYVLLNGESRPAIYPQPVVSTKALRVPVPCLRDGKDVGEVHKERMHSILWGAALTTHTEAQLAETSATNSAGHSTAEDPEVLQKRLETLQFETDKAVLKALQDACQRQRIPLALSLALQLRTEHVIETAITVANHFGRAVVAEALDTILAHKRALTAALHAQQDQQVYQSQSQYSSSEYANEHEPYYEASSSFDTESSPPVPKRVNFSDDNATTATLSSRLSKTMPPPASKAQVVSPPLSGSAEKAPARNPFAVVSSGSGTTPQKRRNVFDGIQDMKASPSPKKPTLNRQSSFSQQARQQRLSDKRIL